MTIYPTVLYIKQHSVTGLKYFGKTTAKDPYKYNGSGADWTDHIKKHGRKHVITIRIFGPFTDSIAISKFALAFSRDNNIVESELWANQKSENGLDGNPKGSTHSDASKKKMSDAKKGKPNGKKGKTSGKQQNPAPEVECPHCGLVGRGGGMARHHFDNCKMKPL